MLIENFAKDSIPFDLYIIHCNSFGITCVGNCVTKDETLNDALGKFLWVRLTSLSWAKKTFVLKEPLFS